MNTKLSKQSGIQTSAPISYIVLVAFEAMRGMSYRHIRSILDQISNDEGFRILSRRGIEFIKVQGLAIDNSSGLLRQLVNFITVTLVASAFLELRYT